MTRRTATMGQDVFEEFYAKSPDPWRFATSEYEREKYATTLASLPRERYRNGVEIGCSIGVLTRLLAERCDAIVGTDMIASALDSARATCADRPNARFEQGAIPGDWPEGQFDLIVLSEVSYFLDRTDFGRLLERVAGSLEVGGDVVLVHWLGLTNFPMTGDEAPETFIAETAAYLKPVRHERTHKYRLDVLTRFA